MFTKEQRVIHDKIRSLLLRALDVESERRRIRKAVSSWKKRHPVQHNAYDNARRSRENGGTGRYTEEQWVKLNDAFGRVCLRCRLPESALWITGRILIPDHVIPLSKGGSNSIDNIQPLCHGRGGCNNIKGSKFQDFRIDERGDKIGGLPILEPSQT